MRWAALLALLLSCSQKQDESETWVDPAEVPQVMAAEKGKVVLLAFGYAGCTEVCPLTLSRLATVHQLLGPAAGQAMLLYVSVDSEHDTEEQLREKVRAHGEGIEAIAPRPEALEPLLTALSASVRKRLPDAKGSYGMDHSAELYGLDRAGRLRVRFSPEASAAQIVRGINKLLSEDR